MSCDKVEIRLIFKEGCAQSKFYEFLKEVERLAESFGLTLKDSTISSLKSSNNNKTKELPWKILNTIYELSKEKEEIFVSDIIKKIGYKNANLVKTINDLEKQKLITKTPYFKDSRKKLIKLTDKGLKLINRNNNKEKEDEEINEFYLLILQNLYSRKSIKDLLINAEIRERLLIKENISLRTTILPKKIKDKLRLWLLSYLNKLVEKGLVTKEKSPVTKKTYYKLTEIGREILNKNTYPKEEVFPKQSIQEIDLPIPLDGKPVSPRILRNYNSIKQFLNSLEGGYNIYKFKNKLFVINHKYKLLFKIKQEFPKAILTELKTIQEVVV